MDYKVFELNTVNNVVDSYVDNKVKATSPIVEIFSALVQGRDLSKFDGRKVDESVKRIKELASRALENDGSAVSELNAIQRFSIEPKLLEAIKLYGFMGTLRNLPYNTVPMMKTYKYESVDSRFQASSGDVPFATHSFREYPIATQTISAGYSCDYRELQSGNFDGTIAEGMQQVRIDMENKVAYYFIMKLYEGIKNAKGVKHYAEGHGIVKAAVDSMLKEMRHYGKINIAGDYAVNSQLSNFVGYKEVDTGVYIPFGADTVANEIRQTGGISKYNGANVVELPNALNLTQMKDDKSGYKTYMPEGLMFFLPQNAVAPFQMFRRGNITTMTGDDIVTRQHMTRFDLEVGAGVAEGREHEIGLLRDTDYELPTV